MRFFALFLLFLVMPIGANAQSAIEYHIWQEERSFDPISRTASAITGIITLSGNPDFASAGSTMTIAFENGSVVGLTSEGAFWRTWELFSEAKKTAEVFRLERDPGLLLHGNTLCGDTELDQTLYAVFFESSQFSGSPKLDMAVFQSQEPPHDINSAGLCGTFAFDIEQASEASPERPGNMDSETGNWELNTNINPIDDTTTVVLSLVADSGSSKYGDPITFIARCKSNKTEAYVVWGDYLGDDSGDVYSEWKNLTVRVGEGEARGERWGVSTDRKATFAPNWAGSFLKELLDQDRLVLQTVPYGENPSTAIFDISGLRTVLGNLAGTCNWSF